MGPNQVTDIHWVTSTGYFGINYVCSGLHRISTRRAYISHRVGFIVRYVDAAFILGVRLTTILKQVQVTIKINRPMKFKRGKRKLLLLFGSHYVYWQRLGNIHTHGPSNNEGNRSRLLSCGMWHRIVCQMGPMFWKNL